MASLSFEVTPCAIKSSPAAMKSSNTFCLCVEPAAIVPGLAVLATATDVGDCEHPALLQPGDARRGKGRVQRDVEAAIGVEQVGAGPAGRSLRRTMNIGTFVPSFDA